MRIGGTDLDDRVLVAGGGGGGAGPPPGWGGGGSSGGGGGGLEGQGGTFFLDGWPGSGGSQSSGGSGCSNSGTLGEGGDGTNSMPGGAGGGGYYGGGAGCLNGGGGGSGYGPPGTIFETGTNGGAGIASVEYVAAPVDAPPVITDLTVTPRKFAPPRVGSGRATDATIDLNLSESAVVKFRIRRDKPKPSSGTAGSARTLTHELAQGAASIPLTAKLGGKAPKPRRYTVTAIATDSAGQQSAPAVTRFRILRP